VADLKRGEEWCDHYNTDGMVRLADEIAAVGGVGLVGKELRGAGGTRAGSGPVHVLVKPADGQTLELVETKEFGLFEEVASKLKKSHEVKELVDRLTELHEEADEFVSLTMPFVVLENSSGMGKTQMAFNLAATNLCEVFYVLCSPSSEKYQSKNCIEKYMPKLERLVISRKCRVYCCTTSSPAFCVVGAHCTGKAVGKTWIGFSSSAERERASRLCSFSMSPPGWTT
jgi:hypothetical protein